MEFSFNGIMYRQIDGVAMGSPLGPILANIFVGYYESKIAEDKWPEVYNWFVDDVFSHFVNRNACDEFLVLLNRLHTALMFTCEHEEDGSPPCMDVRVRRIDTSVETLVYRKPTFTGLYTTWNSFSPPQYKINAVRSLVNRARRICSPSTLDSELDELRKLFRNNGYPKVVLRKYIVPNPPYRIPFIGPRRCPVMIRLPKPSKYFEKKTRDAVRNAYYAARVISVYTTSCAFKLCKDRLPISMMSRVIYNFEC